MDGSECRRREGVGPGVAVVSSHIRSCQQADGRSTGNARGDDLFKKRDTRNCRHDAARLVRIQNVDRRIEAGGKRRPVVAGEFDFYGVVVEEPAGFGGERGRELLGEFGGDRGRKEVRNCNVRVRRCRVECGGKLKGGIGEKQDITRNGAVNETSSAKARAQQPPLYG